MNLLNIIYKEAGSEPVIMKIEDTLENYQKLVGGYIELVALDDKAELVLNEEGKVLGLPMNGFFSSNGKVVDHIAGDYFIVGVEDDFVSLTDDQIEKYLEMAKEGNIKL